MKTKSNKALLAIAFGAAALITVVLLRGMVPELNRYLKIRRM